MSKIKELVKRLSQVSGVKPGDFMSESKNVYQMKAAAMAEIDKKTQIILNYCNEILVAKNEISRRRAKAKHFKPAKNKLEQRLEDLNRVAWFYSSQLRRSYCVNSADVVLRSADAGLDCDTLHCLSSTISLVENNYKLSNEVSRRKITPYKSRLIDRNKNWLIYSVSYLEAISWRNSVDRDGFIFIRRGDRPYVQLTCRVKRKNIPAHLKTLDKRFTEEVLRPLWAGHKS